MCQLQHYSHFSGFYSINPTAFGMAEAHLLLTGQMFVLGIPLDLAKHSLSDFLPRLRQLPGPVFLKLCESSGGFMALIGANSLLLVPAGHVLATWASKSCCGFRWGVSNLDLAPEDKTVLQVVTALLAMYPSLAQSKYAALKSYLKSSM